MCFVEVYVVWLIVNWWEMLVFVGCVVVVVVGVVCFGVVLCYLDKEGIVVVVVCWLLVL